MRHGTFASGLAYKHGRGQGSEGGKDCPRLIQNLAPLQESHTFIVAYGALPSWSLFGAQGL